MLPKSNLYQKVLINKGVLNVIVNMEMVELFSHRTKDIGLDFEGQQKAIVSARHGPRKSDEDIGAARR
jgi:hypothetical protein